MLNASDFLHLNRLHLDALVLAYHGLNLTKFDTESTQFYLTIDTTQIFYLSVKVIFHKVSSMINLYLLPLNSNL